MPPPRQEKPARRTPQRLADQSPAEILLGQLKRTNLQGGASRTKNDLGSGVYLSNMGAGGKVTTEVPIRNHKLDFGLGGFFGQSTLDFPPEMQQYGVPQEETFINKGITHLGGGWTSPSGRRIGVEYNPLLEQIMLRLKLPL